MDISETFRAEDLGKTDFFDFVVTPDVADVQHFNRSMKSVGIFFESFANNNNEEEESAGVGVSKESNNNHLMLDSAGGGEMSSGAFTESSFWSGNHDKETVRWESAMLEDLNCWNQNTDDVDGEEVKQAVGTNTDGAIYTLTVLNGNEQPTWYRAPESMEEDLVDRSAAASQRRLESSGSLDLDTLLNIVPISSADEKFQNGFHGQETSRRESPEPSQVVKTEFTYEDSGYGDKEEHLRIPEIVLPFNNNNDWKLSDNNAAAETSVDSLLRNALQGKSFVRYKKEKEETGSVKDAEEDKAPLMAVKLEGGGVVMLESGCGTSAMLINANNPSSTQSMDDILLSQLDAVSYPEDYEKLKRIENEVAESVEQYCSNPYLVQEHPMAMQMEAVLTLPAAANPVTKPGKKYTKRSSGKSAYATALQNSPGSAARKERSLHYCTICSKGFKDKYSVNVHIRTHTGEKPFACSLCGKSFRQKAHLAKHYHTHLAQAKSAASGTTMAPKSSKSR